MINNLTKFFLSLVAFLGGLVIALLSLYRKGKADEKIATESKINKLNYEKLKSISKTQDWIIKLSNSDLLSILRKKGK
tara:strand:- start:19313 stop:19546 length:234 start_codon:yes stop_codon:yes gene_type:complete